MHRPLTVVLRDPRQADATVEQLMLHGFTAGEVSIVVSLQTMGLLAQPQRSSIAAPGFIGGNAFGAMLSSVARINGGRDVATVGPVVNAFSSRDERSDDVDPLSDALNRFGLDAETSATAASHIRAGGIMLALTPSNSRKHGLGRRILQQAAESHGERPPHALSA